MALLVFPEDSSFSENFWLCCFFKCKLFDEDRVCYHKLSENFGFQENFGKCFRNSHFRVSELFEYQKNASNEDITFFLDLFSSHIASFL